jgi:peptidylprolyl isomerase
MFSRIHNRKRKQPLMSTVPCPNPDGSSPRQTKFDGPPPMCIDPAKDYRAEMVTSMGTMTISLDSASAPLTVNSFVFLARYRYYEGIIFHRIIKGFVCQGGDPTGTGTGGPGYRFADELPKAGRYEVGSLAMANAGPNTNGSQFFLISGQQGVRLPPQYALFGKVVKGLEVVEAMQQVDTDGKDRPKTDVVIESVTISEQ